MLADRKIRTVTTMEDGTGSLTTTTMQDTSQMVSNMGKTDITAIVTTHELAVPAFLHVSEGTDYRQEREIARGAQG